MANEYFVAAINRVGVEEYGDNDFYGTSYFVDPRGQFVGDAASDHDEELVVRDLDLGVIDEVRQQWAFYRDRRPDAYGPLVELMQPTDDLLRRAPARSCRPGWRSTTTSRSRSSAARAATSGTPTGNRYLDFFGGILTTMTAHALPEVTKAVAEQAGRIIHSSTLYLNRPMVELAEQIAAVSDIPDAKVFLTTSGTEANDAALLLATLAAPVEPDPGAAQQLPRPVVLDDRDHRQPGVVADLAVAVPDLLRARRPAVPLAVRRTCRDGEYIAACVADLRGRARPVRRRRRRAASPSRSRASAGSPPVPTGCSGAFAEVLRERGILWITDEVQTGWGRTGEHFWGWQAHGADARTSSPSPRASATGCRWAA